MNKKQKAAQKKRFFNEEYEVCFNRLQPDGYWENGVIETVWVQVRHGQNEKKNHAKAEAIIRQKYPGCKIIRVGYC